MRKLIVLAMTLGLQANTWSQDQLNQILASIEQNNPRLQLARHAVMSASADERTGLTPDNPTVSADYMIGRPVSGGNQFDFVAVQGFEFPTVYSKKKSLAESIIVAYEYEYNQIRRDILVEAKQLAIELVALNKKKDMLSTRVSRTDTLVGNYEQQFTLGEISAVELNKAKLQKLDQEAQRQLVEAELNLKEQELFKLNGNNPITFSINEFPELEPVISLESVVDSAIAGSYQKKYLEQQAVASEVQVQLKRAMKLPSFELGYHYQSVLGQTFNGAHFGISIPLWENRNIVEAAEAEFKFQSFHIEAYTTQYTSRIRQLYEQQSSLSSTINSYKDVLNGLNSHKILKESLELGEIDFITYALELEYFYRAQDKLLELEERYQLILVELFAFKL